LKECLGLELPKDAIDEGGDDIRTGFAQVDRTLNSLFDRVNEKADKS
jgi:hypothetical protein